MKAYSTLKARFRDAPIARKLALIITVTCGVGIVVAGCADFAFQSYSLRTAFRRDFSALASMVAENLGGPLAFSDKKAALEVLGSLKVKPQVKAAVVRYGSGEVFAAIGERAAFTGQAAGTGYAGWTLHTVTPIPGESENPATLHILADFRETFFASLWAFVIGIGCICLIALSIALAVGYLLQRLITRPIFALSQVARRIGHSQDLGMRVAKPGADELGVLTDAFNGMLDRLQATDRELRSSNARLLNEIEERRKLQTQLIETSRLAGMAEVATGVLHNVGNVLNSVNVSAGLMREQLKTSRVESLKRAMAMLREHRTDLPAFLATDEKGKRLPLFLERVTEQIGAEQQSFDGELLALMRNIDHIKQIVAMQQTYAKASAVIEQVDMAELIQQAVSIQGSSLQRHRVQLERSVDADLPPIPTDRNKVLQVVNNFVVNAIHAVKGNPHHDRRISISAVREGERDMLLSVTDNGEGIAPENMGKLFRQGFTTRKEGHGFGLHSGVLVIKTLGGSIDARSEGRGCGATFLLRLPLAPESAATLALSFAK